jgi:hexokinase
MLIEKLMSGLYMGDCARRLLLSFAQRASLFGDVIPDALTQKDSCTTAGEARQALTLLAMTST